MFELNDYEYLLVAFLMLVLLVLSLQKRTVSPPPVKYCVSLDNDYTTILRGIACVLILMGHFASRELNSGSATKIDEWVYHSVANIALVLFMFFSGYGLSLKSYVRVSLSKEYTSRIKKIYLPLLFIGVIYVIFCAILPDRYEIDIIRGKELPPLIHEFHNWTADSWSTFLMALLGYNDWYVICIVYFYTLFYLAQYVSRKFSRNISLTLSTLLMVYTIIAYYYYGINEAHYFRYPCAFMIGHFCAKYAMLQFSRKDLYIDVFLVILFLSTLLYHGIWICLSYICAGILVVLVCYISRYYQVQNKSILFLLGTCSYFFYLSHERICYPLLYYIGVDDLFIWFILTSLISYLLFLLFNFARNHNFFI